MIRTSACALAIGASIVFSAHAQPREQPSTVTPEGAGPIPRAGQATRAHLLGNVEVYSLAIYVDGSITDRAHLASPSVAKALRIEVKYKDVLRRPVSLDWRGELLPRLDAAAMAHVQGTFAPLRYGDVVLVEYVPERGTVVRPLARPASRFRGNEARAAQPPVT